MTREEVKKEAYIETSMAVTSGNIWMTDTFVDKIFDDFESRTCESCRHSRQYFDGNSTQPDCVELLIEVDLDFGCNKWRNK